MTDSTLGVQSIGTHSSGGLLARLNSRWHKAALQGFMVIVLFHWAEHLVQAYQAFVLRWPRPMSMGLLGMYFPWLMKTEVFHYGFAIVMLMGLWLLRGGFTGTSRTWWTVALAIQFWHHIEHLLLIIQATTGRNFFGRPVPTSVLQIWLPRVELHLFYNAVVFVPMVIGMYYHLFPPAEERRAFQCTCAWDAHTGTAA